MLKFRILIIPDVRGNIEAVLRRLIPGQKIAVYPMSTRYSDMFTAEARQCETSDLPGVSLDEPFQAEFLDYDGTTIRVRTDRYRCLSISISDLNDLVAFDSK